jgi:hypothetical protein
MKWGLKKHFTAIGKQELDRIYLLFVQSTNKQQLGEIRKKQ